MTDVTFPVPGTPYIFVISADDNGCVTGVQSNIAPEDPLDPLGVSLDTCQTVAFIEGLLTEYALAQGAHGKVGGAHPNDGGDPPHVPPPPPPPPPPGGNNN